MHAFDICVQACVAHVAIKGRVIIIGSISGYQDASSWASTAAPSSVSPPLSLKRTQPHNIMTSLLTKSASLRGFFLNHYMRQPHVVHAHKKKLWQLVQKGLLIAGVDPTHFYGIESVPDAIDYMYARKNVGKLVVQLDNTKNIVTNVSKL
jgi:NADPH-dependent curcumin reductase CurA